MERGQAKGIQTGRLFKYIFMKLGGSSMPKRGTRIAAIAAFVVTIAACGGSNPPAAQTDVGITSTEILLGNTNALSGAAAAYGTISNAANAYFTYVNNNGGVKGRKVNLKIPDAGHTPPNTAQP